MDQLEVPIRWRRIIQSVVARAPVRHFQVWLRHSDAINPIRLPTNLVPSDPWREEHTTQQTSVTSVEALFLDLPLVRPAPVRAIPMADTSGITLVDNTVPTQQPLSGSSSRQPSTVGRQSSLTRHLSRTAVSDHLARRKYAKWQPERLGVASDTERSPSREGSRLRRPISTSSSSAPASRRSSQQGNSVAAANTGLPEHDGAGSTHVHTRTTTDEAVQSNDGHGHGQASTTAGHITELSELDILYENQRGWFFFGIPLYSHSSLLNFDPPAWMTQDKRPSAVNITNAQVPDPSWEWAWRTWYVDMSGDVDEQGWQYAFSFTTSKWHGTHPWFHSFVRRRRWVRLRTKALERRHRGQSGFEQAHMLNEDYFTIHSSKARGREQSLAGLSRVGTGFLSRVGTAEEEPQTEEISDIPSLLRAMKQTSIDRERIDALKKFVNDGGEELYYLADKVRTPGFTPVDPLFAIPLSQQGTFFWSTHYYEPFSQFPSSYLGAPDHDHVSLPSFSLASHHLFQQDHLRPPSTNFQLNQRGQGQTGAETRQPHPCRGSRKTARHGPGRLGR